MTDAELDELLAQPWGTYREILSGWASLRPNELALRQGGRDAGDDLTWAEMWGGIERIAARMVETGLERGQPVAILGMSTNNYAMVFLAAVIAGGVAAPLTTSATKAQLSAMGLDSGARHLFIDRAKKDELGPDFLSGLEHIVLDEELAAWMAPEGTVAPDFTPEKSDPFNIIYSSGTTGTPKGIVHSHQMRWLQFAPTAASYRATGDAVNGLTSTPLYSNTTMVAFLSTLLAGGTVTIMGKFNTVEWLKLAQEHAISFTMLVPVQYQRLMSEPRFDEFDLSAMKLKYCTSAPFSAKLKAEVLKQMPGGLVEIYSMTEGGVVCLLSAHEFPDKLHTVGRPVPGSELKVLDDDDNEVPAGTPGKLAGIGHAMMSGYKNQPGKTDDAHWTNPEDGRAWIRMGDIGRIDEDGFLELVGRAKDMIISGGFNIYPIDLENELLAEPEVDEAGVVGVDSLKWGETPVGFVTLKPGAERNAAAIMQAVNARLGKTQRLALLHQIEAMPRSHIGKLLKTDLRDMAAELGLPG